MKIQGFYFITDASLSKAGNESDVRAAVKACVSVVQYRNKKGTSRELYEEAVRLRELCRNGPLFIINDRIDIALAADADGVHLGQDDIALKAARKLLGAKKIIGLTVHNTAEAKKAIQEGADYLGVSPIFSTMTKTDAGDPGGISLIKEIKPLSTLPIVAIGGINLFNAFHVIKAGADAICAISATVAQENVAEELQKFQKLFFASK